MKKFKKAIISLMVMATSTYVLPAISSSAELPEILANSYVMFAGADEEAIDINAEYGITVNGDVLTNGTADFDYSYWFNMNGTLTELNGYDTEEMFYIFEEYYDTFFTYDEPFGTFLCDYTLTGAENLNLQLNIMTEGTVTFDVKNINIESSLVAREDIFINGNVMNEHHRVLGALNGDITINGENTNINNFVYAPNGKVTINSDNINFNGVIVAQEIEINCNVLNLNYSQQVADFLNGYTN